MFFMLSEILGEERVDYAKQLLNYRTQFKKIVEYINKQDGS